MWQENKTKKKYDHNCEYCKKGFSRKDSLKRHYRICKKNIIKKKTVNGKGNKCINANKINKSNIKINNGTINKDKTNVNIMLFNFPPDLVHKAAGWTEWSLNNDHSSSTNIQWEQI